MASNQTMYKENVKSINAFVGCLHNCVYCKPSFQRQAQRQKKRCLECYVFKPHFHPKRLLQAPPKTGKDEFIFFPSMGDVKFANRWQMTALIGYANKYLDRTFLMQSKDPTAFQGYSFPPNVVLGITLETDSAFFYDTLSDYHVYSQISDAPNTYWRFYQFAKNVDHSRKAVTIEPILNFRLEEFVSRLQQIKPEFIYIGYDNHGCKLPEPTLAETLELIRKLEDLGFDVRQKKIRKAWWEQ